MRSKINKMRSLWFCALHKSASVFLTKYATAVRDIFFPHWSLYDSVLAKGWQGAQNSFIYAGRRSFASIPASHFFNYDPGFILLIRDPRDILVSEYFSAGYIHSPKGFPIETLELRTKIRNGELTIDEYVLMSSLQNVPFATDRSLFRRLVEELNSFELQAKTNNSLFYVCKYEDMVLDFNEWNQNVLLQLQLTDRDNILLDKYKSEFDLQKLNIRPEQMSHKRKMLPGDYKNKLLPQTIHKLNEIFRDFLIKYKYEF